MPASPAKLMRILPHCSLTLLASADTPTTDPKEIGTGYPRNYVQSLRLDVFRVPSSALGWRMCILKPRVLQTRMQPPFTLRVANARIANVRQGCIPRKGSLSMIPSSLSCYGFYLRSDFVDSYKPKLLRLSSLCPWLCQSRL